MMYSLPNVYKWILILLTVESSSTVFVHVVSRFKMVVKTIKALLHFRKVAKFQTVSSKALRVMDKTLGGP